MSHSKPVLTALAALAAGAALGACGSSGHPAAGRSTTPTTATPAPAATSTTAGPATTAAPAVPASLQATSDQASSVFMRAWEAGNRSAALSVATFPPVSSLFATPYAGQSLNDRGCTDSFPPILCTWGPYAGGTGSIYQVEVTQVAGGWYVSGMTIEP